MSAVRWDDNEISDALAQIRQGDLKWLVFEYDNKPLKMSTIRVKQSGRDYKAFLNAFSSSDANLGYIKGGSSDIFVQNVPDLIGNLKRAFTFVHAKKLQRKYFNDLTEILTISTVDELSVDFLSLELKSNGKQNTAHIRYFPPRGKPKLDNIKTKLNNDALMADLLSPNANPKSPKLPPSRMSDITNKASASEDPPQITRKMAVVMGPAIKKSGHQASNSMPNLILKNKLNKLNQAKEPPKLGADEKELKSSSLSKELKPDDNEPHQVQNGKGNVQTQGSLTSSNNREKEMSKVNSKGADEPIMKPFGRSVSSLKNQFEPQPSSHSATTSERGLTVTKSQEGPRSSFAPKASEVSILKSQETIYKPAPKSNKQNDSSQGKLRKDEPKYASQPILAKETGRSKIQFKDEQPKPSFPPLKSKQGMGSKQSSQESIASSAGSLLAFNAENIDLFHKDDDKPQSKSNETIQPFVKKEKKVHEFWANHTNQPGSTPIKRWIRVEKGFVSVLGTDYEFQPIFDIPINRNALAMLEMEGEDGLKGLVLSTPGGTHIIYPLDHLIDFSTMVKNNLK